MPPRVTLLLGKPPRPGTLLAWVADDLTVRGCAVTVRLPHEDPVRAVDLTGEDLVVHRGLRDSAAPLLGKLDERGLPLCNPWEGDRVLRDRRAWREVLAGVGIPVPPSTAVADWPDVLDHAAGTDEVVVKALAGPGRGARVLGGTARTLPVTAPFPGPYLVEPRLPSDGTDHKLYVVGRDVRGLRKASPLEGGHTTFGVPFQPEPVLVALALEVSRALELHLLGVDVLRTPTGPVVVDVNGFPGFRGVTGAAALVSRHLVEHLTGATDG